MWFRSTVSVLMCKEAWGEQGTGLTNIKQLLTWKEMGGIKNRLLFTWRAEEAVFVQEYLVLGKAVYLQHFDGYIAFLRTNCY